MPTGPVFRFVDPANTATIRLDLRSATGWYVAEGLNLGDKGLTKKWLSQDGVDGAELASAWMEIVTMTIPLIMRPQANASAMETLLNLLNTELKRTVNGIEYMPHGLTGTSYIIDTFRANEMSMNQGNGGYTPWTSPEEGALFVVEIERLPDFRGRGTTA